MDTQTREAAKKFSAKVIEQFDVSRFVLFGSRARRDNRGDNDADLAVVLRGFSRRAESAVTGSVNVMVARNLNLGKLLYGRQRNARE